MTRRRKREGIGRREDMRKREREGGRHGKWEEGSEEERERE